MDNASVYVPRGDVMRWIAFCMTCNKIVDESGNGTACEAAARLHRDGRDLRPYKNRVLGGTIECNIAVGYMYRGYNNHETCNIETKK